MKGHLHFPQEVQPAKSAGAVQLRNSDMAEAKRKGVAWKSLCVYSTRYTIQIATYTRCKEKKARCKRKRSKVESCTCFGLCE